MQRVTITIDDELMTELDRIIEARGYQNRSEAIRDLARAGIRQAAESLDKHRDCVAALVYVYDHNARQLAKRLADTFHDHHELSLASMHAHLDHDNCMEVTILRGKSDEVQHFAEHVIAERGVRHGRVVLVPTDVMIKPHTHADGTAHSHPHQKPAAKKRRRAGVAPSSALRQGPHAGGGLARHPPHLVREFLIIILLGYDVHPGTSCCNGWFSLRGFMSRALLRLFDDGASHLTARIAAIYALLIAANVAAWAWALLTFREHPVLLGTCFLAYSFGLRHAVDADHIAAIDNVTRKLMQEGKQPVTCGLFFSLGHSTVVILATVGVALTAAAFQDQLEEFRAVGGMIGVSVSSAFLLVIAAINVVILVNVYNAFQRVKNGGSYGPAELDLTLAGGGLLARIFRRCSA